MVQTSGARATYTDPTKCRFFLCHRSNSTRFRSGEIVTSNGSIDTILLLSFIHCWPYLIRVNGRYSPVSGFAQRYSGFAPFFNCFPAPSHRQHRPGASSHSSQLTRSLSVISLFPTAFGSDLARNGKISRYQDSSSQLGPRTAQWLQRDSRMIQAEYFLIDARPEKAKKCNPTNDPPAIPTDILY